MAKRPFIKAAVIAVKWGQGNTPTVSLVYYLCLIFINNRELYLWNLIALPHFPVCLHCCWTIKKEELVHSFKHWHWEEYFITDKSNNLIPWLVGMAIAVFITYVAPGKKLWLGPRTDHPTYPVSSKIPWSTRHTANTALLFSHQHWHQTSPTVWVYTITWPWVFFVVN